MLEVFAINVSVQTFNRVSGRVHLNHFGSNWYRKFATKVIQLC